LKHLPISLLAVFAAALSSTLGGSAIVATRFVVPDAGVLPTILLRFVGASIVMFAVFLHRRPGRVATSDYPVVVGLGLVQFALFPWLFTMSLAHVTAARGALILSTQPLITLVLASIVGRERFTGVKVLGGAIALGAVGFALGDRLTATTESAWKGDLYMFAASLSGSLYNVASSYALRKYKALVVAPIMIVGGAVAIAIALVASGDYSGFAAIKPSGWAALIYLMSFGGAFTFFLWIWALEHTAPSRVALAVTFNPISATVLGALVLSEPITWRLLVGLAGIIASLVIVNWRSMTDAWRKRSGT